MSNNQKYRKIIHLDMDAFYASIEELDDPYLVGKPLVVGEDSNRGVISAANYSARAWGVKSAMSSKVAKKMCPNLIFVPARFDRYKQVSKQMNTILHNYTDLVEPLALDEAFLDVTTNHLNFKSATLLAARIRGQIKKEIGLSASAGISINKFVSKIASDYNKPNGQKTVVPSRVQAFLDPLDVIKLFGIGKVTAQKLYQLGIFSVYDLRTVSDSVLEKNFTNRAPYFKSIARGIDHSKVRRFREVKSISCERTFELNLTSELFLDDHIKKLVKQLYDRLENKKRFGKTLTLKIKYSDFTIQTRSVTYQAQLTSKSQLYYGFKKLLFQEKLKNSVRLIGLSISNFNEKKSKNPVYKQLEIDFKCKNF